METKKPTEAEPAAKKKEAPAAAALEFSDDQKRRIERADQMYKEGKRDKLKAAAGNLVPEDKQQALMELSDALCSGGDFDFSDGEKALKRPPVDVLIDIFAAIPKAASSLEKELEFSDTGTEKEVIDYASMANQF